MVRGRILGRPRRGARIIRVQKPPPRAVALSRSGDEGVPCALASDCGSELGRRFHAELGHRRSVQQPCGSWTEEEVVGDVVEWRASGERHLELERRESLEPVGVRRGRDSSGDDDFLARAVCPWFGAKPLECSQRTCQAVARFAAATRSSKPGCL